MKWFKLAVLVLLTLALAGCGDGGAGDGYATYHAVLDAATGGGSEDLVAMTQKPGPPAPGHDQKGCPEAILLLVLPVYAAYRRIKNKAFLRMCSRFIKVRVGRFGLYVGFHRGPYRFCFASNLAHGERR